MTSIEAAREGRHILVYTDGSCHGNPGPGGYAAVMMRMDGSDVLKKRKPILGYVAEETTNVKMEMMAVIAALEALKPDEQEPIVVYCDNDMIPKAMNEWIQGWIANGWRKSNKEPVKNRDLWERLVAAAEGKIVEWRWVKAHAGHPYNEEVDRLAQAQKEKARPAYYGFAA
ncbi:ribonuclease HI [Nitratireductor aquimarinus]|uniref:ribonuclease HI n=1 Tax=Nitratireductor aquimarinus TaxID=889300 RepID=UPI002935D6EE|nr:ribonuclease HI [Nitratireductor aquimarinus]MDV2968852.1 ribonuclease HI [Nitratireductor aquimarinus]